MASDPSHTTKPLEVGSLRFTATTSWDDPTKITDDRIIAGSNTLLGLDPERLMLLDPADLPALLNLQYAELANRAADLLDRAQKLMERYKNGAVPIADDVENATFTNLMKQLGDFLGDKGESETTRIKVKAQPLDACHKIDGWFRALSDPIKDVMGDGRRATIGTLQYAQTQYLIAKGKQEQAEREAAARQAQERAAKLVQQAQDLADQQVSEDEVEAAIEEVIQAETHAAAASSAATAPIKDMVRSRTALGHMSTLTSAWDFTVLDMKALCRAVADGKVPATFVTTVDQAIRLAVRAKHAPLRKCPGLEINQIYSARR